LPERNVYSIELTQEAADVLKRDPGRTEEYKSILEACSNSTILGLDLKDKHPDCKPSDKLHVKLTIEAGDVTFVENGVTKLENISRDRLPDTTPTNDPLATFPSLP
jgi:hypothetical protein